MKRIMIILPFCLAGLWLNAQSMSFYNPISVVTGTLAEIGPGGELEADWGVINTTAEPISVKARREMVVEVPGSSNYFCWGVCYDSTTTVGLVPQTIQANDTNFTFYAHYRPLGNTGTTGIKYVFYLANNSFNLVSQTVAFCVESDCTIGVNEQEQIGGMFWNGANPFEGFGAMNYQLANGQNRGTLTVMNLAGQVVKDVHLYNAKGQVFFDARDFSSGMYLFQLKSNGELLGTQKIMVK
jgi:hypothetical protein